MASSSSDRGKAQPGSLLASWRGADLEDQEFNGAFAELIGPADVDDFFDHVWQQAPRVFCAENGKGAPAPRPIRRHTWEDCLDHLAFAWGAAPVRIPDACDLLTFKGKQMTHQYEDLGPCAALLDGASCVVNHAEVVWAPFADLVMRLRERLVHVYVNTYTTPGNSQAVPPHADDRDVFILQLCGCKHWRVYGSPPIKHPYTDEQVGKGIPIPEEVLQQPPLIECDLHPGDVLYMPRGYVHEACCPGGESSWHATLAVATHDWSWSKVYTAALKEALDREASRRWRAAVPLGLGAPTGSASHATAEALSTAELQDLAAFACSAVDAAGLQEAFKSRLVSHNEHQEKTIDFFQGGLAALPPDWETRQDERLDYMRALAIRSDSQIRMVTQEEREAFLDSWNCGGKGFGKNGKGKAIKGGKGCKGLQAPPIRAELEHTVEGVLGELSRRGERGMAVHEFAQAAAATGKPNGVFDELARLCMARVALSMGMIQRCGGSASVPPLTPAIAGDASAAAPTGAASGTAARQPGTPCSLA